MDEEVFVCLETRRDVATAIIDGGILFTVRDERDIPVKASREDLLNALADPRTQKTSLRGRPRLDGDCDWALAVAGSFGMLYFEFLGPSADQGIALSSATRLAREMGSTVRDPRTPKPTLSERDDVL